jgi:RNA polymerase sigma factor (sigma-70 family)
VNERDRLAESFEGHRARLRSVAQRILGSPAEADDAVQEAWLRLSRADTHDVANLGGWLTTVVARVCLDMLRSRKSRREEATDGHVHDRPAHGEDAPQPEKDLLLADSVGVALFVVLETLAPAERVAFVLHDMFDLSYENIAHIIGRSLAATRQLASRARRRVQSGPAAADADETQHRALVGAFLAASREGDLRALVALLDPDVVLRADPEAVQTAAANAARGVPLLASEIRGATAVIDVLKGRARGARPATIDGFSGATWAPGGKPRAVFGFVVEDGRIVEIEIIANPARVAEMDVVLG